MKINDSAVNIVYLAPEQMEQMVEMVVNRLHKDLSPVKDRISQREAYRLYGSGFVKQMVVLHPEIRVRRGNLWQYSRVQLDKLNYAQAVPELKPYRRYAKRAVE